MLKDSGHRLLQLLPLVFALLVLEGLGRVYLVHLHLLLVDLAIQANGLQLFQPPLYPTVLIVARGLGLPILQRRLFLRVLIVFLELGLELLGHPQWANVRPVLGEHGQVYLVLQLLEEFVSTVVPVLGHRLLKLHQFLHVKVALEGRGLPTLGQLQPVSVVWLEHGLLLLEQVSLQFVRHVIEVHGR